MRTAPAIFRILMAKYRFSLLSLKRGSTDSTNFHFSIKAGHRRAKRMKLSIVNVVVEKNTITTENRLINNHKILHLQLQLLLTD